MKMKRVNITVCVDEKLKKQAETLFLELGMDMPTAFNIFLHQSVREQQIPFKISKDVLNEITLNAIEKAEKNEDIYGSFSDVSSLMNELNS